MTWGCSTVSSSSRPGLDLVFRTHIALAKVIRRCLARDPAKRYPSMKELSLDLRAALHARRRMVRLRAALAAAAGLLAFAALEMLLR
jgi:hypothetical protein